MKIQKFTLGKKQDSPAKGLMLSVTMLILFSMVSWSQSMQPNYDQAFQPIQPKTLKADLSDTNNDPVRMYDLIRRGDTQNQRNLVYDTLDAMRKKEPNNAVVIAAYCFAYKIAEGDYADPSQKVSPPKSLDPEQYSDALLEAYQLNPKLWLTYAVEGHNLMDSPFKDQKALFLLKKAVKLAPDISYTHTLLGDAYGVYDTPYHSFKKAEAQYIIAQHLQPVSAHNADMLFDLYDIRMPNKQKAKEAKQYLLSTVPPDYQFPSAFRARLAKY